MRKAKIYVGHIFHIHIFSAVRISKECQYKLPTRLLNYSVSKLSSLCKMELEKQAKVKLRLG